MQIDYQEFEEPCTCRKGVIPIRLASNGPLGLLDRNSGTCTSCQRTFRLFTEDGVNGIRVIAVGAGIDYDLLRFETLRSMYGVVKEAIRFGDNSRDLLEQYRLICDAAKRRTWELIGIVNGGTRRSLARWQTKTLCEKWQMNLRPAGEYDFGEGRTQTISYEIIESGPPAEIVA